MNPTERLLKEYEAFKKSNALMYYDPHRKQDLFHKAGEFKLRYMRTGNRFGKSEMGAAEDVSWALGYRPWYKEGDPARTVGIPKRSVKILVICQDWDKVNEIFTSMEPGAGQGKIMRYLPEGALAEQPRKSKAGVVSEIKVNSIHGGMSTIMFDTVKSFMHNPMGQESSDWDAIHVDEPCPEEQWNAISRGLVDRDGSAWFTCTPLAYMWINDMFVPRGQLRKNQEAAHVDEKKSSWMMTGSMHDNPHLTEGAKARYLDRLPAHQRQCRELGIPIALSGVIYKSFDRDKHVYDDVPYGWKDHWSPPADYTIRYAVDPHPEVPHAVLFAATAPTGQVFYFNEIFEHCLADMLCDKILTMLNGRVPFVEWMDLTGFKESPTDGSSMASIFDENGLFVEPGSKDLSRGIIQVQMELNKTITLPSGVVVAKHQFSPYLTETLWEFDHYEWDPKKSNKPLDKNDHMMENLYRLVVGELGYVNPEPESNPVTFNPHRISHNGQKRLQGA